MIHDHSLLPQRGVEMELTAKEDGYVEYIDAMRIGMASQHTGAGRERKEDDVDLSAGLYLHRKAGDKVKIGDVICSVYGNNVKKVEKALEEAGNAVKIGEVKKEAGTLIKKIIR